jgi:hypothetical protein
MSSTSSFTRACDSRELGADTARAHFGHLHQRVVWVAAIEFVQKLLSDG